MTTEKYFMKPHHDVELGFNRNDLEYFLTFPTYGINSDTGVILFVTPFGDSPESVYQSEKLRPFLADNYNCVVVGVKYFGMDRMLKHVTFDPASLLTVIEDKYGIPHAEFLNDNGSLSSNFLDILVHHLKRKRVKLFSEYMPYIHTAYHKLGEYQSFGFLPALDYLVVLGEVLKKYPVNKNKIIVYGSSYGGYIALLLGKFAPHTFSTIIDNAGYSKAVIQQVCTKDLNAGFDIYRDNDVVIKGVAPEPWTLLDETDPYYFSDSCRSIRSLLEENHRIVSKTAYFIFHGENDEVCPTKDKEKLVEILAKYNPTFFKKVTENDLDGVVFKNMSHGMNASLRGLFQLVYSIDNRKLVKETSTTDFDLENVHRFDCGRKIYRLSFSNDYELKVDILDK